MQGPWPGASVSARRLDQHCPAAKTTVGAIRIFDVSEWRRRPLPIMSLSHNYYYYIAGARPLRHVKRQSRRTPQRASVIILLPR